MKMKVEGDGLSQKSFAPFGITQVALVLRKPAATCAFPCHKTRLARCVCGAKALSKKMTTHHFTFTATPRNIKEIARIYDNINNVDCAISRYETGDIACRKDFHYLSFSTITTEGEQREKLMEAGLTYHMCYYHKDDWIAYDALVADGKIVAEEDASSHSETPGYAAIYYYWPHMEEPAAKRYRLKPINPETGSYQWTTTEDPAFNESLEIAPLPHCLNFDCLA